jgi:hypothetical protein
MEKKVPTIIVLIVSSFALAIPQDNPSKLRVFIKTQYGEDV